MKPQTPAWLLVGGAAFALRLWLIWRYPALFGGDSVVRLANVDRILLSYQLPGLQVLLYAVGQATASIFWFRLLMACISAVAAVGFLRLARHFLPGGAAVAAALFFATSPFPVAYSTVPYQEILMLAGLCFAAAFWLEGKPVPASIALAAACWTRYEAWLLCPVLVLAEARLNGWAAGALARASLLWCWGPALWIALHAGLTPQGGYAVEALWNPERLWRWAYLGWITFKNGWMLLPLALLGAAVIRSKKLWSEGRYQATGLFLGLFLLAILFSSHGEREQPDRFVTAREAHLLLAATALQAGLGWSGIRRGKTAAAVAVLSVQCVAADRFVAGEVGAPRIRLAYEAARYLHTAVSPGDTALALAQPVPKQMLVRFLETAERRGGRAAAIRTLRALDVSPPDSQRIRVQAGLPRDRWFSLSTFPTDVIPEARPLPEVQPDWVLRWSDFRAANEAERRWADRVATLDPIQVFQTEEVRLELFRLAP